MRVNKFNIHWQIVRVKARSKKNICEKIKYVMDFYEENKNYHNYKRVLNWLQMTALGYKNRWDRVLFSEAASKISSDVSEVVGWYIDIENDLSKVAKEDLIKVYKDLAKRKYGFQFKSIPKGHSIFLNELEEHIND